MKQKWFKDVDFLIQIHFLCLLKEISEEQRGNIPLEDLIKLNNNVFWLKTVYRKARKEIKNFFIKEIGTAPLAIIPAGICAPLSLSADSFNDFYKVDINKKKMKVMLTERQVVEKYNHFMKIDPDTSVVEDLMKKHIAQHKDAESEGLELSVSIPPLDFFKEKMEKCRKKGISTELYLTSGNYHVKNFIEKFRWNIFEPNEDMLLVHEYYVNSGNQRKWHFHVVLDQVPSIDKYDVLNKYREMCKPLNIAGLHGIDYPV